jgi:general stress protein 26
MKRQVYVAPLLVTILLSPSTLGQTSPAATPDRSQIIRGAREVMQKAHYCAFITIGDQGQPQARVVEPSPPDDEFAVWVGTSPVTRKVVQIRKDPRVTLFYFDAATRAYVTLIGGADFVSDPAERAKHWQEEWSSFYKDKYRGSDFVLLRVKPRRLEIVSYAHGLGNDPQTWRPVILDLQ